MKKNKFAIIGSPISHSLSPVMHNYWFDKYNINAEYELLDITENEIQNVMNRIKDQDIKGINVTLPYKKSVIPFLNKTINDANETHSVNTIMLDENGNLIGENTDVFGFRAAYLKSMPNQEKKNKKAFFLRGGEEKKPNIWFDVPNKKLGIRFPDRFCRRASRDSSRSRLGIPRLSTSRRQFEVARDEKSSAYTTSSLPLLRILSQISRTPFLN